MNGNEATDVRPVDLETLNVGKDTHLIGCNTDSGKVGLVAVSSIRGGVVWFGRRWQKGNSSPVGKAVGDLDFGRAFAKSVGLGGYLVQNDHSREKLSASTHLKKENGADADLSGAAGHYQWGWNVPMYYQKYEDDTYEYETFSIGGPRKGFWNYYIPVGSRSCAGYAAMDRTNSILKSAVNSTAQYRGCNNDSSQDSTYKSGLCKPATNINISTFRAAARRNGTLWFANERTMQYVTAALKRVIFGNRNIQASYNALYDEDGLRQGGTGEGIDMPNNWASNFGYYPYIRLDVGIDQGDLTGLISTTIEEAGATKAINNIPSFYGLKNDYKYLGAISENMLLSANADYSQSLFINNNVDGSLMNLDSTSGLTHIATGPAGSGWLYSKNYTMKNLAFFPGIELGASASTYYCDGYYNPHINSGLRAATLLGLASYGGDAGSLSLRGHSAVSHALAGLGAFLCEWAEAFTTEPFWCQES